MYRAILVLPIALSAGAFGCAESEAPAQGRPQGPAPAANVQIARAEAGSLSDRWSFLGQARAALSSQLAAGAGGPVARVSVREGDRVTRGQTLLVLDTGLAAADLAASRALEERLEAELAQARRQLARLAQTGSALSEPERERFELDVATLTAQLAAQRAESQRASVQLGRHYVKAPYDGVVGARKVNPGTWVNIGEAVLDVISLDELEIHVDVTADLGGTLAAGDVAEVRGASATGASIEATIAGVVPALDAATRTMRVRLIPAERPAWLVPGLAVDVEFDVDLTGQGVIVPRDALIRGPVETRVVKVVGDQGQPLTVEVVATSEDKALVRGEGLAAGDALVVRGNERLRPGQPLRVVE